MSRSRRSAPLSLAIAIAVLPAVYAACAEPTAAPAPRGSLALLEASGGAKLLPCAGGADESVSDVIGPAGGTLTLGKSSITIPSSAVAEPTRFTLTVPASTVMEVRIEAAGYAHYTFARPASVTIAYERCGGVNQLTRLGAWYIDDATKSYLEAMASADDKSKKIVTFETGHLSSYAVAY